MSTPRFLPYRKLKAGFRFGRAPSAQFQWHEADEFDVVERVQVRAAQMQNDLVHLMTPAIESAHGAASVARISGFSAQRFQRLMRGEVLLRLEDLAAVELATGAQIEFVVTLPTERASAEAALLRQQLRTRQREAERSRTNSRAQQPRRSS